MAFPSMSIPAFFVPLLNYVRFVYLTSVWTWYADLMRRQVTRPADVHASSCNHFHADTPTTSPNASCSDLLQMQDLVLRLFVPLVGLFVQRSICPEKLACEPAS